MGNKKMGRPTDSPKHISLKVLLDNDTAEMLERCAETLGMSKAEVMRRGVLEIYSKLPE